MKRSKRQSSGQGCEPPSRRSGPPQVRAKADTAHPQDLPVRDLVRMLTKRLCEIATDADAASQLSRLTGAIDAVCEQIRSGTPDEQFAGMMALAAINPDPYVVMPVLENALCNGVEPIGASYALSQLGVVAIPSLLRAAREGSPNVRFEALTAAGRVLGHESTLFRAAIEGMSDSDEMVRSAATSILTTLSLSLTLVIPTLMEIASEQDGSSPDEAHRAIKELTRPYADLLNDRLLSSDPRQRRTALTHLPEAIAFSDETVAQLAETAISDPSDDLRVSALLSLEQVGLLAGQGLATVMAALGRAQECQTHTEMRTRSLLVQERIRESLAPFIGVPRASVRITSPERRKAAPRKTNGVIAPNHGVLAMLNTLLAWGDAPVSQERIRRSELFALERQKLGLEPTCSKPTVHNYLVVLAGMCGATSILETDAKRQRSWFRPGIIEKLQVVADHLAPLVRTQTAGREASVKGLPFKREP